MLLNKVKEATIKILVFPIGKLHLAAKLDGVIKVIRMPEIFKSGDKLLGIANFEDQEVIVVDIHEKIYGQSVSKAKGFLVIIQNTKNLCGITVPSLPTIKEIPLSALQPLPNEYRDRDTLGIASHIAQVPMDKDKDTMQTAFLLDAELLLKIADHQADSAA